MARRERRNELIARRELVGWTQESLAHHLQVDVTTVASWEAGRRTPLPSIRRALATALDVTLTELNRLLGLESVATGSLKTFDAVTEWLSLYVRAEQSAVTIWTLGSNAFPALCQTADYARVVEQTGYQRFAVEDIDRLVAAKMERAAVLEAAEEFVALVASPLLDAIKGSAGIMAGQIARLASVAQRPNVTLQLIDLQHLSAAPGEFTLLRTIARPDPDLAAEFGAKSVGYEEGTLAAADHVMLFRHLRALARTPDDSAKALERACARFSAMTPNQEEVA